MDHRPNGRQLKISWELVTNMHKGEDRFSAYLELSNQSYHVLPASGWTIYFNQVEGIIDTGSVSPQVSLQQVAGAFYKINPTAAFEPLAMGQSLRIDYEGSIWVIKESGAPCGFYIVFENNDGSEQRPELINNVELLPFKRPEQLKRTAKDQVPIWTPAWQYEQNASFRKLPPNQFSAIIPTPQKINSGKGLLQLDHNFVIRFHGELGKEAFFLQEQLKLILGMSLPFGPTENEDRKSIVITLDDISVKGLPEKARDEAYFLTVSQNQGIKIIAGHKAGVFYGIQSLLALLPIASLEKKQKSIEIAETTILDYPRYPYRGLHLDVARNFHEKETVLKLLDLMATYKLNKFHFHLTDDEGWRLEIPEIPELTKIGAFRGHTHTEEDHLYPAYGSGPFPNPKTSHGSGFYSKSEFIEILRYAYHRHIEVIPEFDFPGHARAAIKAMAARYNKLMAKGDEDGALQYLLHDPKDQSVYKSVQHYTDNVICVGQESTYQFLEQIVQSTVSMYQEAGVPLQAIHIGGDEVPEGVWQQSPVCKNLINDAATLKSNADLSAYFLKRINEILEKHQLLTAGWEEIALQKIDQGYEPNLDFADKNFRPYVWNNLWGFQDLSNRLANAGYPVVLCHVTNLYFDLAYNKDPREPGLHWGGFVDTRKAFEFSPGDIFKSSKVDHLGNPYNLSELYEKLESLTPTGRENILGIQGQLWSETIKSQEMLETAVLPRLLGLAERAWSEEPAWEQMEDQISREKTLDEAWNVFVNQLGQSAIPKLDYLSGGFHYRIPPPGAVKKEGRLWANVSFPGLHIHYTTDGSEPSRNSIYYQGPIKVEGEVKLKAFNDLGRGSRTVVLEECKG